MAINNNKPSLWKSDIANSIDYYNQWFLSSVPEVYRVNRDKAHSKVKDVFEYTHMLEDISPDTLRKHPAIVQVLRMCTCPPIARDRLVGLASVSRSLVNSMEVKDKLPSKSTTPNTDTDLQQICEIIRKMLDTDLFTWINQSTIPTSDELQRAYLIVADRLCGTLSDPIIRNSQEQRQLQLIREWLESNGYCFLETIDDNTPVSGTFTFRHNVISIIGEFPGKEREVIISIDVFVVRKDCSKSKTPVLIEAKSAGDFVNVNKRRKEEAQKMNSLKRRFGSDVCYILFLSGYFDTGYLGYEAAEGIDWVWEHRISDLKKAGL